MSIKQEVTKGVFWIAVAKYSGIVIQLFITAILARLITPAAFGTIAVAIVILSFLNIFADIGIGTAVVQFKQLTRQDLNSLFTINVYGGTFLATLLFLSSDFISFYYGDSVLRTACQLMSVVALANALNVVPNAMMRKDKRFRAIAFRTLFFQVFSGAIAIWGAFHGWGIYALLVTPIVTSVGVFLVNFYNYPQSFVFKISKNAVHTVASFSFFQFAFSFFNYFSRNLDKLIIGKYLSLTQLGYYDKSYHLMLLPVQNVTFVIEPVLHPILSSLQDDKKQLAEKNCKLAVTLSNISFPIGLVLYFCAAEIIKIVYGGKWDAAIPVFCILALSLPLQMIMSTSGAIYQAAGKTNWLFYNGILNTAVTISGFLVAVICFRTIEAVAWSWVLTLAFNFITSYFILCVVVLRQSYFPFLKSFVPQVFNSLVVFTIVRMFANVFPDEGLLVNLLCKSALVILVTFLMSHLLKQYKIQTIYHYIMHYVKR